MGSDRNLDLLLEQLYYLTAKSAKVFSNISFALFAFFAVKIKFCPATIPFIVDLLIFLPAFEALTVTLDRVKLGRSHPLFLL